MFCGNCGAQMSDTAVFCKKCGHKRIIETSTVSEETVPVQEEKIVLEKVEPTVEKVYSEHTVNNAEIHETVNKPEIHESPDKPKKHKKKTGLIVGLVIVLIAIIAAVAGIILFPKFKVNSAIDANDISTINKYYSFLLLPADKENVQSAMVEYCDKKCDKFYADKIDYEDLEEDFGLLSEKILKDNDEFDNIVTKVNELNDSHKAFNAGTKAVDEEDFTTAVTKLEKVIKKDSNYSSAQDLLDYAKELKESREAYDKAVKALEDEDYQTASENFALVSILDSKYEDAMEKMQECTPHMIMGTWTTSVNIGDFILDSLIDFNYYGSDLNFPVVINLVFDSINMGYIQVSIEDKDAIVDSMIDLYVDILVKEYEEEYGFSFEDLNALFEAAEGYDIYEYIKRNYDYDDIFDELDRKFPFSYAVDGNLIEIVLESGESNTGTITGNTIELDIDDLGYDFLRGSTLSFTRKN